MEFRNLGRSGLRVSAIGQGCKNFGIAGAIGPGQLEQDVKAGERRLSQQELAEVDTIAGTTPA